MKTIRIEDMNWVDIKEAINNGFTTVVIGVGSNEQHGPHLPTKTDSLIGDAMAHSFALKWGNALQAPTISVGCSDHHMDFPGTITLKKETLKAILADYIESLIRHGFKTIILLPSHGGNFSTVRELVEEYKKNSGKARVVGIFDMMGFIEMCAKLGKEFNITQEEAGAHSGDTETSAMLYLAKDLVKKERFQPGYVKIFDDKAEEIVMTKGVKGLSEIGVIGDPRKATGDKGKIYLEKTVDFCVAEIKKMLK